MRPKNREVVSRKRNLKETSVRTVLQRPEQKDYLRHEEKGRAYVCRAPCGAEPWKNWLSRISHGRPTTGH